MDCWTSTSQPELQQLAQKETYSTLASLQVGFLSPVRLRFLFEKKNDVHHLCEGSNTTTIGLPFTLSFAVERGDMDRHMLLVQPAVRSPHCHKIEFWVPLLFSKGTAQYCTNFGNNEFLNHDQGSHCLLMPAADSRHWRQVWFAKMISHTRCAWVPV